MKLLCIKKDSTATFVHDKSPAPPCEKHLIVGEYYEATDEIELDDGLYFFIQGFLNDECFHYSLFAQIDTDLDETTLVNEEWEEKVCVPVNSKLCV